ncbi:MAG TPA: P-loop NTPase fold protein [Roseomonas sp.]|jgi:hypothetical protein
MMTDEPAEAPKFEFELLAETLAGTLAAPRKTAFVLGLHGPWGAGKTTMMRAIQRRLPTGSVVVDFNAWKYQDREALWRALILRVLAALKDHGGDPAMIRELERSLYESFTKTEQGPLKVNWAAAISEALQIGIGVAALGVGGGVFGSVAGTVRRLLGQKSGEEGKSEDSAKRIERIAGIFQRVSTQRSIQQVVSIEQFSHLFGEVTGSIRQLSGARVYVLVDDLDRCLPDAALQVFEAIKLFLDAPECAYVVAVDRAVVSRGLELRYPQGPNPVGRPTPPVVDADEYIEKTISLSVEVPLLSTADATALLNETMEMSGLSFSAVEAQSVVHALGSNPRRLKRFANTAALWINVGGALGHKGVALAFNPSTAASRGLFLKLSIIGYLNSGLLAQMQRDPELPRRLQSAVNVAVANNAANPSKRLAEELANELPGVTQAMLEPALLRAFQSQPLLNDSPEHKMALRWFRTIASDGGAQ